MKRSIQFQVVILATALGAMGGCGPGDGNSGIIAVAPAPAPTPSPTPTPPPTPPPAISEVARIFDNPELTPGFFVTGGGWVFDTATSEGRLVELDADSFGFGWDAAAGGYRIASADFGSGLLTRISDYYAYPFAYQSGFAAKVDKTVADSSYNSMFVMETARTSDPYSYATVLDTAVQIDRPDRTKRASWVWVGIAQPTPAGGVQGAGTVRYTGDLAATIQYNFGDQLSGTAQIDVDFATGAVSGTLDVYLKCFMGCAYPVTRYTIDTGTIDRSAGLLTAKVSAGGDLGGRFAGPVGEELLLRIKLTYPNPETKRDEQAAGVIILRRT